MAITVTYAFGVSFAILKVIDLVATFHVPGRVQIAGLDQELHGETAYDLT